MTKNYKFSNKVIKKAGGKQRVSACFYCQNWTSPYKMCTK